MGYEIKIDSWLEDAATLIRGIDVSAVADAAENLIRVRNANGTIFLAGNGGSASTANHLALDLQPALRPGQHRPGRNGAAAAGLAGGCVDGPLAVRRDVALSDR